MMNMEAPSVSIVLLGQFQPNNFLPNKLADGKVITKKTASSAFFAVLAPGQMVQFKLDWGDVLVVETQFQIVTSEMPYIRICDFVVKAVGGLAPESVVTAFGINVERHYDFQSIEARNKLGKQLAPPEAWGAWGKTLAAEMEEGKGGGLLNIQMRQPFHESNLTSWRDVVVAPSPKNKTGVILRANHHHQVQVLESSGDKSNENLSEDDTKSRLLTRLSEIFEKSITDSLSIFDGVVV